MSLGPEIAQALSDLVRGARHAADPRRAEARKRVRDELPSDIGGLRHQWLGNMSAGCAATHGVSEACDFSCTACYLATTANSTPPLPFSEVAAQLRTIRDHTGPAGNVQITAGEVTLLPVDDLIRIVRYARELELDPMLMTHGQRLLEEPEYLHRLMIEAGLSKVAIHVDSTQRGRRGVSKRPSEQELMSVRDQFAELVRDARRTTGRPLHAAHTFTVTRDNLDDVPNVVRWFLDNSDAFRMLSFQPTAEVGRTRVDELRGGDAVWDRICEAAGDRLNAHTFTMGHLDCNSVCLAFMVRYGGESRLVEVKRQGAEDDARLFDELFAGAFPGFYTDDVRSPAELAGRLLSVLLRSPSYITRIPRGLWTRAYAERRWLPRLLATVASRGEWSVHPLVFVVHNFMSASELDTVEGKKRLASCAFRVPVGDEMVSMCELNGTELRRQLNNAQRQRLDLRTYELRRSR